jgi:aspartyl-tRNA(Asn)/glutamyl-tRNA(Gln) amidotransferase subunit A
VPGAIGADGGGSIRIPAALCGVYGLKPSYGRVSRKGDSFSGSLDHVGPIAASTLDLAVFLDAMHGPDAGDPASLHAVPPSMPFAEAVTRSVRGFSIGIDEHEWRDADAAVVKACEQALKGLSAQGVELVDITLKTAKHAVAMGALTIASEAYASTAYDFARHVEAYGADVQAFMHIASVLEAKEYLWAQALRERLRRDVANTLLQVDLIASPTTAKTALPVNQSEERTGRLDAQAVRAMCRYTFFGNLTGLPAGTVPVGLDPDGLPIGLQLMGDAWDEASVLACMAELERCGAARASRAPHRATWVDQA